MNPWAAWAIVGLTVLYGFSYSVVMGLFALAMWAVVIVLGRSVLK